MSNSCQPHFWWRSLIEIVGLKVTHFHDEDHIYWISCPPPSPWRRPAYYNSKVLSQLLVNFEDGILQHEGRERIWEEDQRSPEIETCFMSTDERARILSKCQSPYIGGDIGNFSGPRAYIERKRSEFSKSQEYQEKNLNKYEEIWREYEEIMKDIWRI